jgi:hypothetical protein
VKTQRGKSSIQSSPHSTKAADFFNVSHLLQWSSLGEEYSSDLLKTRIAAYVEGTDRQHEVSLARAKFWSALTEVLYRTGRIDIETYKREINGAFGPDLDLANDPEGLCSKAEALMSFQMHARFRLLRSACLGILDGAKELLPYQEQRAVQPFGPLVARPGEGEKSDHRS